MKSLVKLLAFMFLALLIPTLVMGTINILGASEMVMIIGQILVMVLMVVAFTRGFSVIRKYEIKTEELIKDAKSVEELKKLREERLTDRSKANITKEIIKRNYSRKEAETLRKYTNSTEDMKHYYSAIIANSKERQREEAKIKRDNFNKKYKNRTRICPDFRENLRTTGKWLVVFIMLVVGVSLAKKGMAGHSSFAFMIYILGLLMLFVVMINSIIWIMRTASSYWERNFI